MEISQLLYLVMLTVAAVYGSSEVSGDSSQTSARSRSRRHCCFRDTKRVIAGYDHKRRPYYLDVGVCRKACNPSQSRLQSLHLLSAPQQCQPRHNCRPTSEHVQRVHLAEGSREIATIKDCACTAQPKRCARISRHMVFFPDSPFERSVDVGMCTGRCRGELACRPVLNRTITIPGPMGDEVIEVIDKCHCEKSCYRVPYYDTVFDYYINETTYALERRSRTINIGRCVGGCGGGGGGGGDGDHSSGSRCVLWSKGKSRRCLMNLYSKESASCQPTKYYAETFRNSNYEKKTVLTVQDCGCV